jgi:hypothetical protein
MKRAMIFAALAAGLGAGASEARANPLSAAELREAVTGKTVFLRTQGIEVPISYRGNGTMQGRLRAFAAAFAGGARSTDTGKWWIADGQLCQRWNSWLDGQSYCYRLSRNGTQVRWHRNDGRSGTARIGG